MEVNGSEDIGDFRSSDIKLGEYLELAAGRSRINLKLSRDGDEIFLQHLQRNNASSRTPVLGHQIAGTSLFHGRRFVVRVNEDVGIEEATSAHEPRRD